MKTLRVQRQIAATGIQTDEMEALLKRAFSSAGISVAVKQGRSTATSATLSVSGQTKFGAWIVDFDLTAGSNNDVEVELTWVNTAGVEPFQEDVFEKLLVAPVTFLEDGLPSGTLISPDGVKSVQRFSRSVYEHHDKMIASIRAMQDHFQEFWQGFALALTFLEKSKI